LGFHLTEGTSPTQPHVYITDMCTDDDNSNAASVRCPHLSHPDPSKSPMALLAEDMDILMHKHKLHTIAVEKRVGTLGVMRTKLKARTK